MTKIRNFRITLRPREIARYLKNHAQMQMTPALEASVEHAISDSKRWLQPAAVYTTLTRATAQKTTALALPKEAVAASVVAVTIGSGLEQERLQAVLRQDTLQTALLAAVQEEALSQ